MVRLLPFVLIPILLLAGLWYLRSTSQSSPTIPLIGEQAPQEVPKTVPGATVEDRVRVLEDTLSKLTLQSSSAKPVSSQTITSNSLDSRIANLESAVTELKTRVSALEKATPTTTTSTTNKYPLYIPLGAGGGPWGDQDWNSLAEYQVAINPDNYSGYSSMQLEANFRLVESAGTGYVRLYNITDKSAVVSELSTTSTAFGIQTSAAFTLPAGQKTYTIQVKSSQGKNLFVQSARIKVNF